MDKIKELINDKNKEKIRGVRISNTVPVNLTFSKNQVPKSLSEQWLDAISRGKQKNRLLIDWFSVSLSPIIAPCHWKLIENHRGDTLDEYIKVPTDYSGDPEILGTYYKRGELKLMTHYFNMKFMTPDEFFEWFFKEFDFLDVARNEDGTLKFEDVGGGQGFNAGRAYEIFSSDRGNGEDVKNPKLIFRYFDPYKTEGKHIEGDNYKAKSAYTKNKAEANYVRQKINMTLSGNALQGLREHGVFMHFFRYLYKCFRDPVVTRFDGTLDLFNYGFKPKYFADLAEKNKYLGRSRLNVAGNIHNPSVYIGAFKKSRTIMIYDKQAENKDKTEADEPALLDAVNALDTNTWTRCEQVFTSHEDEANQVFNRLIGDTWLDETHEVRKDDESGYCEFIGGLGTILKTTFDKKCRFLKKPKKDKNNERIGTDKNWQLILDKLSEADSGFTFNRPKLTLDERYDNFIYRSLGGPKLFADIYDVKGEAGLDAALEGLKARVIAISQQRVEQEAEQEAEQ